MTVVGLRPHIMTLRHSSDVSSAGSVNESVTGQCVTLTCFTSVNYSGIYHNFNVGLNKNIKVKKKAYL